MTQCLLRCYLKQNIYHFSSSAFLTYGPNINRIWGIEENGVNCLLLDRVLFAPAKGILAAHDCVFLHDSSGKPVNKPEESCTARYSGRGTCTRAGHFGGFGMGQLGA